MKRLEVRFKVVTPCFLGGHGHQAELRLPSIKGALRFWWRAITYARMAEANRDGIIERLASAERSLFGASETGQSRLIMTLNAEDGRLQVLKNGTILRDAHGATVGPGARYLGYGVMEAFASRNKRTEAGQLTRSCLAAPFDVSLRIGARETEPLRSIAPALRLLGLLGGLGSKSRKGYGSVNLTALEGDGVDRWRPPRTEDDYRKELCTLLQDAEGCHDEPDISAFSAHARVDAFESHRTPLAALNAYGEAMVRYRSWGRNGQILNGEQAHARFREDHEWMYDRPPSPDFHPRRAVFGLPHNYGKGKMVEPESHDRRASPLLFHVHETGSRYVGVAVLLRSRFLPNGERIRAGRASVPAKPDWNVLTDFLDANKRRTIWPDG